ncbi:hypothetical protein ACJJI5_10045 [Microbulbifer sp. EKSA008]|uniref:hypothetical protein n=1 Tax=unclassified Microbulbifer TaxID=2619833 RepID=UPI0040391A7B
MLYASATWVGSRDLDEFASEGFNQLGDSTLKSTSADAYWTIDLKLTFDVTENLSLYLGGNNLTDYTQVEEGESPLFWNASGAYDAAFIYGPLRGRDYHQGFDWNL